MNFSPIPILLDMVFTGNENYQRLRSFSLPNCSSNWIIPFPHVSSYSRIFLQTRLFCILSSVFPIFSAYNLEFLFRFEDEYRVRSPDFLPDFFRLRFLQVTLLSATFFFYVRPRMEFLHHTPFMDPQMAEIL